MKRILPTWCKEVKKSMIDDDINVTELAERVGFSERKTEMGGNHAHAAGNIVCIRISFLHSNSRETS